MTTLRQRPLKHTAHGGSASPAFPAATARGGSLSPDFRPARAFTLLELLVVLVILAVLAALLLPALSRARLDALAVRSSQNLRTLAAANLAYAGDTGTYVPADDKWNNRRWHGARTSSAAPFDPTRGFLAPYLGKSKQVTTCPLFADLVKGRPTFEEGTGGYGYNATYLGGTPLGSYSADGTRKAATLGSIPRPATTLMFATAAYATRDGLIEYPFAEPPFWDFGAGPTAQRPFPTVHFRAGGRAILAWADGHISYESEQARPPGTNPHGGEADPHHLGWPGPDEQNGYWNPHREP